MQDPKPEEFRTEYRGFRRNRREQVLIVRMSPAETVRYNLLRKAGFVGLAVAWLAGLGFIGLLGGGGWSLLTWLVGFLALACAVLSAIYFGRARLVQAQADYRYREMQQKGYGSRSRHDMEGPTRRIVPPPTAGRAYLRDRIPPSDLTEGQ